jgi:hypothetical protein
MLLLCIRIGSRTFSNHREGLHMSLRTLIRFVMFAALLLPTQVALAAEGDAADTKKVAERSAIDENWLMKFIAVGSVTVLLTTIAFLFTHRISRPASRVTPNQRAKMQQAFEEEGEWAALQESVWAMIGELPGRLQKAEEKCERIPNKAVLQIKKSYLAELQERLKRLQSNLEKDPQPDWQACNSLLVGIEAILSKEEESIDQLVG